MDTPAQPQNSDTQTPKEPKSWTPPPLERIGEDVQGDRNHDALITRIAKSERYRRIKVNFDSYWKEFLAGSLPSQTHGSERINQLVGSAGSRLETARRRIATPLVPDHTDPRSIAALPERANLQVQNGCSKPAPLPLIAAGAMIVSFFLPWAQLLGFGASGYNLAQFGSYGNLAWLIPISGAVVILSNLVAPGSRPVQVLAGIVPWAGLFYGLANIGEDLFHILSIGPYIALVAGAVLIFTPSRNHAI